MKVNRAFLNTQLSFGGWKQHQFHQPVLVIWGRSNVGKSSLINRLVNRKRLAFTSKKPGKTQAIHFYEVVANQPYYLVDLPGYGYARLQKTLVTQFTQQIVDFLTATAILKHIFVVVDSSIAWQERDLIVFKQLKMWQIPFSIILNKVDKLNAQRRLTKRQTALEWSEQVFLFSARQQTSQFLIHLHQFMMNLLNNQALPQTP